MHEDTLKNIEISKCMNLVTIKRKVLGAFISIIIKKISVK